MRLLGGARFLSGRGGEATASFSSLPQKLITLASDTNSANLVPSMNVAFRLFRSSAVTPRATPQGPQTYTGTLAWTTFSINSDRGG